MSLRLLCIGDLHLRSGDHLGDVVECLRFAAGVADERQVHGVLIAGDIFEGRSTPEERAAFGDVLGELTLDGRSVNVVRGNHDQREDLAVYSGYPGVIVHEQPGILLLSHPDSTTLVDVLCVPWPERAFLAANGYAGEAGDQAGSAALAAMLRAMVATRAFPGRPLVVLGHMQVLGAMSSSAQPLIGRAIEVALGDLQDLGAAAVVLGHVHRPQELAPNIHYCGSISCHDFGEEGEEKRIGVLTIDDAGAASWEWILTPCRRWHTIEAEVRDGAILETCDSDSMWSTIGGIPFIPDAAARDACLRYRYHCAESDQALFDHAALERRFSGAHTLKIVPVVERNQRVRAAEVAAARTVEEKLFAYGQAAGVEITPSLVAKLTTLESEATNG